MQTGEVQEEGAGVGSGRELIHYRLRPRDPAIPNVRERKQLTQNQHCGERLVRQRRDERKEATNPTRGKNRRNPNYEKK